MNNFKTLAVYLGSSGRSRPIFQESAQKLGQTIAKAKKNLVYGGMNAGLMGILAKTALEHDAHVTGIIPKKIKDSERILPNLSETIMVNDLWDRKKRMFLKSDAILALPGGFGTLDEASEVLYWGNLGLHHKPLLLINIENYWDPAIEFLESLPDFDKRFLIIAKNIEDSITALENWAPIPPVSTPDSFPHFEDEICRDTETPILIDRATIENTYYLICALGLKQLGKHNRAIGILNTNGQFDKLLEWLNLAAKETFITQKCLKLYSVSDNETKLHKLLKDQEEIIIDLHKEKWG